MAAVYAAALYWLNSDAVVERSLAGGSLHTVASVSGPFGEETFAVDSSGIYWTMGSGDLVLSRTSGGSVTTLVMQPNIGGNIATNSSALYWSASPPVMNTPTAGTIMRLLKSGGAPVPLVSTLNDPIGIAIDNDSLYWAQLNDQGTGCTSCGAIMSAPIEGGVARTLVGNQNSPSGIISDTTSLYWIIPGHYGSIMKLTPK